MKSLWSALLLCVASAFGGAIDPLNDWPAWRGPTGDGIAAPGQNPPTTWSETNNIAWKVSLPGRGHGSPTVVGGQIFLATSAPDKRSQSVLALDRQTGKSLWETEVHPGGADYGKHAHSSGASSSVASDGDKIYINFLNNGAVYTTALTREGKVAWQKKICDYVTHQGFGASPIVYENLLLVSADHRGGGVVAGLDRKNGEIVWSHARPQIPNYTSPSVLKAAGKIQMVMGGCNVVTSLDPATGKKLWEVAGSTEECVGSAVTDGLRVFTGGGWPKNHTICIAADGSGTVVWQNGSRVYVPSMIAKDGHFYAVMDAGIAVCWKSQTGEEVWKERLGGDFFASPIMAGDRIYASNLKGTGYVFEATPKSFKLLAQNQLGDEAYASPVICGNRIYLRVAKKGEPRQEFLYCVADTRGEVR